MDIWGIEDGRSLPGRRGRIPQGQGKVTGMAFSPDGRQLAVTYAGGDLRLWDVELGMSQFPNLVGPKNAKALCYSPDGQWLIQAGGSPIIDVWDPRTGKRLQSLKGHLPVSIHGGWVTGGVRGAACSPDGKWLATGGGDGMIRLWDAKTFQPLAVLSVVTIKSGFQSTARGMVPLRASFGIDSLTFTADSSQLVAVRMDSKICVYDLKPIEKKLHHPAKSRLAETEAETGLVLQGDRPVPNQHIRLARDGETFRPTYEQDWQELMAQLVRAESLIRASCFNDARELLVSLLAEPGVPELVVGMARPLLAQAYLGLGQLDQAEAEARKALAINPNGLYGRVVLAQTLAARKRALERELKQQGP